MGLGTVEACLELIFDTYAQHIVSSLALKTMKEKWLKSAAKTEIDTTKEGTIALLMEDLMSRSGEEFVEFTQDYESALNKFMTRFF